MIQPVAQWTEAMQSSWNLYQEFLQCTRAYGRPLPAANRPAPPPIHGSTIYWAFVFAHSSPAEQARLITEARQDIIEWKARLKPAHSIDPSTVTINI